jgi:type IV secretory pathway VirB2 component (pilin)
MGADIWPSNQSCSVAKASHAVHTPITKLCRLLAGSVGKLGAVRGVVAEDAGLFHGPIDVSRFGPVTKGLFYVV